ncbi:MAG: hypothetical protein ACFFC7_12715 [Candidatus Hermodarchaeota archaeon]
MKVLKRGFFKSQDFKYKYALFILIGILLATGAIGCVYSVLMTPEHYSYIQESLESVNLPLEDEFPPAYAIEAGDLNQDGTEEIITAYRSREYGMLISRWQEKERHDVYSFDEYIPKIALGQFDHDLELEIVIGFNYFAGTLEDKQWLSLLDADSASFETWEATSFGQINLIVQALTVLDANENGLDDLVVASVNGTSGSVVLEIYMDGNFQDSQIIAQDPLNSITIMETVNLDEDPKVELVVGGEQVLVYDQISQTFWNETRIVTLPKHCVTSGIKPIDLGSGETGLVISCFGSRTFYGQPILGIYQQSSNGWVSLCEYKYSQPISTLEIFDIDQDGVEEILAPVINYRSITDWRSSVGISYVQSSDVIIVYSWSSHNQSLVQEDEIIMSTDLGRIWGIKSIDTQLFVLREHLFSVVSKINDSSLIHLGFFIEAGLYFCLGNVIVVLFYLNINRLSFSNRLKALLLFLSSYILLGLLEFALYEFQIGKTPLFTVFSDITQIFIGLGSTIILFKEFLVLLQERKDQITRWLVFITGSSLILLLPIRARFEAYTHISKYWVGFTGFQMDFSSSIDPFIIITMTIVTWSILSCTAFLGYSLFTRWGEFTNEKAIHYLRGFFFSQMLIFCTVFITFLSPWFVNPLYLEDFQLYTTLILFMIQLLSIMSLIFIIGVIQRIFTRRFEENPLRYHILPLSALVILGFIFFIRLIGPTSYFLIDFYFLIDLDYFLLVSLGGFILRIDEVFFLIFFGVGLLFLYIAYKVNKESANFSLWAIGLSFLCWTVPFWLAKVLGIVLMVWGFVTDLEPEFVDSLRLIFQDFVKDYISTMVDLSEARDHTKKIQLAYNAFAAFAKDIEKTKHIKLDLPSQEIEEYVQNALAIIKSTYEGDIIT